MQSQKQWEGKLKQSSFLHFREGVKNLFMESVASSNHLHESTLVEFYTNVQATVCFKCVLTVGIF